MWKHYGKHKIQSLQTEIHKLVPEIKVMSITNFTGEYGSFSKRNKLSVTGVVIREEFIQAECQGELHKLSSNLSWVLKGR